MSFYLLSQYSRFLGSTLPKRTSWQAWDVGLTDNLSLLNFKKTGLIFCRKRNFSAEGEDIMINSIVRLKNLCEIMISMGFSEYVNEKEIKNLIEKLETIISEEMKLLKERESTSDWR
jgi:ribosomal protein L5